MSNSIQLLKMLCDLLNEIVWCQAARISSIHVTQTCNSPKISIHINEKISIYNLKSIIYFSIPANTFLLDLLANLSKYLDLFTPYNILQDKKNADRNFVFNCIWISIYCKLIDTNLWNFYWCYSCISMLKYICYSLPVDPTFWKKNTTTNLSISVVPLKDYMHVNICC